MRTFLFKLFFRKEYEELIKARQDRIDLWGRILKLEYELHKDEIDSEDTSQIFNPP